MAALEKPGAFFHDAISFAACVGNNLKCTFLLAYTLAAALHGVREQKLELNIARSERPTLLCSRACEVCLLSHHVAPTDGIEN